MTDPRILSDIRERMESPKSLGYVFSDYIGDVSVLMNTIDVLTEERDRLREALRFYADKDNWGKDDWNVKATICSPEYGEPGRIARVALGEEVQE